MIYALLVLMLTQDYPAFRLSSLDVNAGGIPFAKGDTLYPDIFPIVKERILYALHSEKNVQCLVSRDSTGKTEHRWQVVGQTLSRRWEEADKHYIISQDFIRRYRVILKNRNIMLWD